MSEVSSIAIIGAGTMGSGIAITAAMSGIRAHLVDVMPEQLERAKEFMRARGMTEEQIEERIRRAREQSASGGAP